MDRTCNEYDGHCKIRHIISYHRTLTVAEHSEPSPVPSIQICICYGRQMRPFRLLVNSPLRLAYKKSLRIPNQNP